MNTRFLLCLGALILASVSVFWVRLVAQLPAAYPEIDAANSRPAQPSRSAVVARMFAVTMLEFETDRPLQEVRVIKNENVLGSLKILDGDNQNTLKLAVAVSERQKNATVYVETPNYSADFTSYYPPIKDARDERPREYTKPEKNIKLPKSGWIEVYGVSTKRFLGADCTDYQLKIEIR